MVLPYRDLFLFIYKRDAEGGNDVIYVFVTYDNHGYGFHRATYINIYVFLYLFCVDNIYCAYYCDKRVTIIQRTALFIKTHKIQRLHL